MSATSTSRARSMSASRAVRTPDQLDPGVGQVHSLRQQRRSEADTLSVLAGIVVTVLTGAGQAYGDLDLRFFQSQLIILQFTRALRDFFFQKTVAIQ